MAAAVIRGGVLRSILIMIQATVFGLTARGEYFGDDKGVAGFGTNIFDVTLSGNIHISNLTIIPEFRLDACKRSTFL